MAFSWLYNLDVKELEQQRKMNKKNIAMHTKEQNKLLKPQLPTLQEFDEQFDYLFQKSMYAEFIIHYMIRHLCTRNQDLVFEVANDSHYTHQHDAQAHDALLCVQTGSLLSDTDRFKFHGDGHYIKSAGEMRRLFAEVKKCPKGYEERLRRPTCLTGSKPFTPHSRSTPFLPPKPQPAPPKPAPPKPKPPKPKPPKPEPMPPKDLQSKDQPPPIPKLKFPDGTIVEKSTGGRAGSRTCPSLSALLRFVLAAERAAPRERAGQERGHLLRCMCALSRGRPVRGSSLCCQLLWPAIGAVGRARNRV